MKGFLLGTVLSVLLHGQTATPAFEVASVKSSAADGRRIGMDYLPGGRLVMTNLPLFIIVATAYGVPFQSSPQLSGGPDWIRAERYDIEAKAESGALTGLTSGKRREKLRLMLQTLLAERFHLQVRRETKSIPVYALVPAKGGVKLQPAAIGDQDCDTPAANGVACHTILGGQGRGLHGQAVDLSDVARYLGNFAERPVVDRTGLHGLFRIETRGWTPLSGKPAAPGAKAEDGTELANVPTIFEAMGEVGLRLEAQRAPVDVIVIEHIEKPSGN